LNVSRAVRADYNHDEDQFIASARLLLDEGSCRTGITLISTLPTWFLFMQGCSP
jgi:hypothetical protein